MRILGIVTKNKEIFVRIFQENQKDNNLIGWTKTNFTKRRRFGKP